MRITGGILRGRQVRVPKGDRVRPTTDRVREALFSVLRDRVEGAAFLDLYAGSGAVGLGAWSRGARPVWWVEQHSSSLAVLRRNVEGLCDEGTRIVRDDAVRFLKKGLVPARFDIIFADPPYREGDWSSAIGRRDGRGKRRSEEGQEGGLSAVLLAAAAAGDVLAPDGLFVVEQRAGSHYRPVEGWELVRERVYGISCLRVFRQVLKGGSNDTVGDIRG